MCFGLLESESVNFSEMSRELFGRSSFVCLFSFVLFPSLSESSYTSGYLSFPPLTESSFKVPSAAALFLFARGCLEEYHFLLQSIVTFFFLKRGEMSNSAQVVQN